MGGDDADDNTILKTALTAVAKAELDLANTLVKAPSRGVVTDLTTDVGRYAGTGSPVLTLIVIHDVWINAEFTENNLGHVEVGTPVEILFDVLPGRVFKGEVRSIGLGTSAGSRPAGGHPADDPERPRLAAAIPALPGDHRLRHATGCGTAPQPAHRRAGLRHGLQRRDQRPQAAGQGLHPPCELVLLCLLK